MKKENDIKVKLFRVEGDAAPFIKVDYVDKNAEEHTGLLLLDSCSMGNILSPEMVDQIGMLCKVEDEGTKLFSIAHETIEAENVRFYFSFGGSVWQDIFCITPRPIPVKVQGMDVIGILGIRFLKQFRLVIDYSDFTLHKSEVAPENLASTDCVFFFPMEIGLTHYGLPVVCTRQNGKEIVTLVDTGATKNMIARKTLDDNAFEYKSLEDRDVMRGLTGNVDVEMARVMFHLVSLYGEEERETSHRDRFAVLSDYIYEPKKEYFENADDQVPPAEMLLGAPFMAARGWVLDFGAGIIYKRRTKEALKETV